MTSLPTTESTPDKLAAPKRLDFNPILNSHTGTRLFVSALERSKSGEQLMRLLGCYIQFNAIFGSGVAHLAGEIGVRTDLFRDSDDPVPILADRSVEVAASVFFAAIDEFGDRISLARCTHRSLAQATIKAVGEYLGLTHSEVDAALRPDVATITAISEVQAGYGFKRALAERDLFRGLGFHLGSEMLADEEFRALDAHLQSQKPELVQFLNNKEVSISGRRCRAYHWIKMHTTAEAEHSDAGGRAVELALQYYAGPHSQPEIEKFILDGFAEFAALQTRFMASLSG